MDIAPDLSHLNDNEKKIIEAVGNRQKADEHLDTFRILSRDNDDYSSPPFALSSRHYSQLLNESGVFCQICRKTKFVNEESSRQCSICKRYICARCCIRLKSHSYICHQCQDKQEHCSSLPNNRCKHYLSDYILSQTIDENLMNKYGANQKRIVPILNMTNDDDISSPESMSTCDNKNRLIPDIRKNIRSTNILRDFQYHSLEDRESGQESTLKDSGIDTASSSTILNVISSDQLKKPMTFWSFNEARTEQLGNIYLRNNLSTNELDKQQITKDDILNALGLKIQAGIQYQSESITEITKVIRGSMADAYGQLQVDDQILEWNGEKLTNVHPNEVNRIIFHTSIQSPQIHLLVKRRLKRTISPNHDHLRSNRTSQEDRTISSTIENSSGIQLQVSFQYDQKYLHVMIHGAKNIPIQQGLFACQVLFQCGYDIASREEKCTKAQSCLSGMCIWNQHIIFFDIESIDNIFLWIKLINLEHNQEVLGDIKLHQLNLTNQPEWYHLNDVSNELSINRALSSATDISSTTSNRKRQLPDIPLAKLHANGEKVSQELLQRAIDLKFKLQMRQAKDKSTIKQLSFDHTDLIDTPIPEDFLSADEDNARKSRTSLVSSSRVSLPTSSKERPRLPIIRDRSEPSPILARRLTVIGQDTIKIERPKPKSLEDKYRHLLIKRHSAEIPSEDIDSDGSELSSVSKMSSLSKLSTQSERPRPIRKLGEQKRMTDHFQRQDEVQLNEEELRQMASRTYETSATPVINTTKTVDTSQTPTPTPPTPPTPQPTKLTPAIASNEKTMKTEQRSDGTLSDSILTSQPESCRKRRPSMSSKAFVILGLSKKTNSSSSKRYGFQRSEEIGVQPHLRSRASQRDLTKESEAPNSAPPQAETRSPFSSALQRDQYNSMPNNMKLWSGALKLPHEHQFTEFIEGLGRGQLVGRQVLASPCHGEIQIGLRGYQGLLEVEIVRARNLLQKPFYKMPPAPYVKVYLLDGKTCIEKQRTRTTRRTLDPLIQQTLTFKESFRERVLQISVWGDYSKLDRKIFMGVCQISLDEVNLNSSQQILDWYKLFSSNSLMNNYTIVQQSPKRKSSLA